MVEPRPVWLVAGRGSEPAELLLQDRGKYMHDELRTLKNTYGVGIMLAQEIGFEGIIELARRAEAEGLPQAEPQWVLEAAGLWPMTQWKLSQAFARTLGTPMRSPRRWPPSSRPWTPSSFPGRNWARSAGTRPSSSPWTPCASSATTAST